MSCICARFLPFVSDVLALTFVSSSFAPNARVLYFHLLPRRDFLRMLRPFLLKRCCYPCRSFGRPMLASSRDFRCHPCRHVRCPRYHQNVTLALDVVLSHELCASCQPWHLQADPSVSASRLHHWLLVAHGGAVIPQDDKIAWELSEAEAVVAGCCRSGCRRSCRVPPRAPAACVCARLRRVRVCRRMYL